ncbi:MAG TPA: hypothetical protein VHJ57_03560 [Nitrososphaeraceae archaeon]|nr:hypothetical protein [Nitrososphaeraceae archaeon]
MPHIVLTNVSDFESFYHNFKKEVLIIKNEEKDQTTSTIIRFEDILLNQLKNLLLIKTIVIENGNQSQTYYIMVMKKNIDQITIRLDPLTDPKNKTDAVKISLANIAKQYKKIDPEISIGRTNLEQYLL